MEIVLAPATKHSFVQIMKLITGAEPKEWNGNTWAYPEK